MAGFIFQLLPYVVLYLLVCKGAFSRPNSSSSVTPASYIDVLASFTGDIYLAFWKINVLEIDGWDIFLCCLRHSESLVNMHWLFSGLISPLTRPFWNLLLLLIFELMHYWHQIVKKKSVITPSKPQLRQSRKTSLTSWRHEWVNTYLFELFLYFVLSLLSDKYTF